VDLSALIFVALAVAWAVYLIPKALKHHDDVVRSRSVDRFSHSMRVLARREPVSRRNARLVVTPGRAASPPVVTKKGAAPAPAPSARETVRESTRRATRRRRRVLGLILLANIATGAVAALGYVDDWYAAIPGALLVAWLVACRLMVRREHASLRGLGQPGDPDEDDPVPDAARLDAVTASYEDDDTGQIRAIDDPSLWDPMPVTLPTYVGKPAAPRSVRTIDVDSTGVWTSGRTEADAQIAREADQADRAARAQKQSGDGHRAVGS
jgi:hypothetical protein